MADARGVYRRRHYPVRRARWVPVGKAVVPPPPIIGDATYELRAGPTVELELRARSAVEMELRTGSAVELELRANSAVAMELRTRS